VSPTRVRAIVIGASLAGLFAATLFRKAGWHTEVFERSLVELVGRGAGITTHQELLQSLWIQDHQTAPSGVHQSC